MCLISGEHAADAVAEDEPHVTDREGFTPVSREAND
jgi:hypothetical protein